MTDQVLSSTKRKVFRLHPISSKQEPQVSSIALADYHDDDDDIEGPKQVVSASKPSESAAVVASSMYTKFQVIQELVYFYKNDINSKYIVLCSSFRMYLIPMSLKQRVIR